MRFCCSETLTDAGHKKNNKLSGNYNINLQNMKLFILLITIIVLSTTVKAQAPGNIQFSKTGVTLNKIEAPVNQFSAGDPIYCIAYLPASIQKLYNAKPESKVEVEIFIYTIKPPLYDYQQPQEEQLVTASMWVSGTSLQNNYLIIDIVPEPDKTTAYGNPEISYKKFGDKYDGPVAFAENLAKLPAGKNTIKVVVNCKYEETASGTYTIEGNNFEVYASKSAELNKIAASAGAKSAQFPESKLKDAATESKMIAALKNSNHWKTGFIGGTEILRIAIADNDWIIRRNEISGAILHRYIRAYIAFKTKENTCAYRMITFQEDYVGGKFQALKYDGAADKVAIVCENL
jgi:hypothetical protein